MQPLNLSQLSIGERVQHELLVVDRLEKTQGNGDPFVILKLGNASGHIDVAPIWFNQREWADGADRGRVVQAIGQVGLYAKTGKRQIQLTGPLRVLPSEQVDLHAFLPRIAGDTTRLWDWIDKRRAEISTPALRRVVDLFYADDNFRVQLEQTPGSVNGHHAKLGGQLLDLQHMILSHHGSLEFGSPVQLMTAEAEIVHWADEASAKANDMIESLEDSEAFASGHEFSDKKSWRVGRRIWRRPDGIWEG